MRRELRVSDYCAGPTAGKVTGAKRDFGECGLIPGLDRRPQAAFVFPCVGCFDQAI